MKVKLDKKTKKISCKTKEEWLSKRVIGGTTLSAILGKSKWATPSDVYNELALGKRKTIADNERMATGRANEDLLAKLFANDFKNEYEVIGAPKGRIWLFYRVDKPYITCTPDRLLINKQTGELEGLEIKDVEIVSKDEREMWLSHAIPPNYLYQCIHYFITFPNMKKVTLYPNLKFYKFIDNEKVYDYSMHLRLTFYREEVEKLIEHCEKQIDEFWNNHIVKKVRPQRVIHL